MTDAQESDVLLRVAKRDRTVEPFVMAKLLNCIRRGLIASGEPLGLDTTTAGGLAEAVFEYLTASFPDDPVASRHLSEIVDLVLNQTGHASAALAIRDHATMRDRQRRRTMVATPRPSDGRFVQHRWNKTHLVQHLRRKHQLNAQTARIIAGRVEELMLDCGLAVVTAGLVREMARSELLAWGLLSGALVVKRSRRGHRGSRVQRGPEPA